MRAKLLRGFVRQHVQPWWQAVWNARSQPSQSTKNSSSSSLPHTRHASSLRGAAVDDIVQCYFSVAVPFIKAVVAERLSLR